MAFRRLVGAAAALVLAIRKLLAWRRRQTHGLQIQGSLCLVTGASSGVGKETAVALAKRGAKCVLLVARNRERLEEVAGRVRAAGAKAEIYSAELSDPVLVSNLSAKILATHGTPSLLVHAAGAGRWRRLTEMSAQHALECMNSPYTSAMLMTRAFLPAMLKIERGHISIPQSPACCTPPLPEP